MILASYGYEKPKTTARLFELMRGGNAMLLAGGTDIVPLLREEKIAPELLIDIKGIDDFKGIRREPGGIFIGSAETVQAVAEHPLALPYTALIEGAGRLGCYEIRRRATIGGNICNGSPSADCLPGLLVYDAEVSIISENGERTVPLESLLLGPGKVGLHPGEVMRGVILKVPKNGSRSRYYRLSRVKGMDLSGISAAVFCEGLSGFRIALGAVWPTVARARKAEDILNGGAFTPELLENAVAAILADVKPRRGSMRASPEYKRAMIPELIKMAICDMNRGALL